MVVISHFFPSVLDILILAHIGTNSPIMYLVKISFYIIEKTECAITYLANGPVLHNVASKRHYAPTFKNNYLVGIIYTHIYVDLICEEILS